MITSFLLCVLACFGMYTHTHMQTCAYKPELLKDVVPTEYTAYTLLTRNPLPHDVTYVAIPWTWLLNNKKLDTLPNTIHVHNGFTVCQHIYYERILPILRSMGVTVLFTPHASRAKTYNDITVLPFPHYAVCTGDPAQHKDLLYSFCGAQTHTTRKQFFAIRHPPNTFVCKRKGWHFWISKKKQKHNKREYIDALTRSRFAPCLRGTGASTVRFWEALKAGAIPVLVSDDMALPAEVDWESCIIRVPEKNVLSLREVISKITLEQEWAMRAHCIKVYTQFSGDNFIQTIRHYFDSIYGRSVC